MRLRPLSAVVMAAGEGTRMRSALPKPLHPLCGRPMLLHVLDALSELLVDRAVVVVGHGAERVTKTLQEYGPPDLIIDFVDQHVQLAAAEAELRRRINHRWMQVGVTMVDPERTYVDAGVRLAADVTLFPGTILQGRTVVAEGAKLGPHVRLVDCVVGEGANVEQSVGYDAVVGPSAI